MNYHSMKSHVACTILYDIECRGHAREVLMHICNNMVRVSE